MAAPRTDLEDLPFGVMRTALTFRRFSDTTLRALGLAPQPPGIAVVLHTLHELGDCTVNVLVESTHVPNGTLTGLLDALEREGHVRRAANAEDGRSWLVQLTPSGRTLCAALDQRHRLVMRVFAQALSQKESAELSQLLRKLTAAMRAYVAAQDSSSKIRRPRKLAPTTRGSSGGRRRVRAVATASSPPAKSGSTRGVS